MQIEIPNEQFLELNLIKHRILVELAKKAKYIEYKYLLPLVPGCYNKLMNSKHLTIIQAVNIHLKETFLFDLFEKGNYDDIVQVLKAGM